MFTRNERNGYLILGLIFMVSLYLAFTNPEYFNTGFTVEDGPVEYGTAFMLFCLSLLCIFRLFKLGPGKSITWKIGVFGFAVLFFFGAGEEISWGQRIFGIESGEFFMQNNAQKETNLHNLVVGGKKVNKIIFSQLLMAGMVFYLLVLPWLYRRYENIKNLADRFAVPVVQWQHTIAFITATVLVAIMPPDRKWEVYELAFGVIFFLIFLNPLNGHIFEKSE